MLEGQLLNERYKIKYVIGGGGMANVYAADDLILNRRVAIKILKLEYANDLEFIERFDREAQAATSLNHPNIVNVYDVGEEENIMYIVMELVQGMTLKEYIQTKHPPDIKDVVRIMIELTEAINHAHEHDLIHRDIKPQNILLDQNGTVKVTDFGIAIALSATALTQTNSILGSVHYLSPEQARGGIATKQSDIYALGIVFYELLTGKLPFTGETAVSIALKHLQTETPSVKEFNNNIPQSIDNIVKRATDKNPLARFDSVIQFNEALLDCLNPSKQDETVYQSSISRGEDTKIIPLKKYNEVSNELEETKQLEQYKTKKIKPVNQTKRNNRFRKPFIVLLIISFMTLIGFIMFVITQPKTVIIPDVQGKEYEKARDELEALNLKIERKLIFSDDYEPELIVRSNPKASRSVKEESIITLFVSDGKEPIEMMDYLGDNINQVEKVLKDAGYNDVMYYEKSSDKPSGEIINQVQPKPKKKVVPSETTVIFEVSQGQKTMIFDDFIGKNKDVLTGYAEIHNIKVDISEEYSTTIDKNYIIKQSPAPGTEIEADSTVSITISKGEKELESRIQTEKFIVSVDKDNDEEQEIVIYVDDLENELTNIFKEDIINQDKEYEIELKIEKGKNAEYKVERNGEEVINKTISYKEGS